MLKNHSWCCSAGESAESKADRPRGQCDAAGEIKWQGRYSHRPLKGIIWETGDQIEMKQSTGQTKSGKNCQIKLPELKKVLSDHFIPGVKKGAARSGTLFPKQG